MDPLLLITFLKLYVEELILYEILLETKSRL